MGAKKNLIRGGRGRQFFSFLLLILLGLLVLIAQGIIPDIWGVRIEWFLIVIIYVGIYKSLWAGVLIATILGISLDFYSGTNFGEGLFSAFFVMGAARIVSSISYVDKTPIQFVCVFVVIMGLYATLALFFLLLGFYVGPFGYFLYMSFSSSIASAAVGVLLLRFLKLIDPERGGYYLTRFMTEEREIPLI